MPYYNLETNCLLEGSFLLSLPSSIPLPPWKATCTLQSTPDLVATTAALGRSPFSILECRTMDDPVELGPSVFCQGVEIYSKVVSTVARARMRGHAVRCTLMLVSGDMEVICGRIHTRQWQRFRCRILACLRAMLEPRPCNTTGNSHLWEQHPGTGRCGG